jgi:hypothetical protein
VLKWDCAQKIISVRIFFKQERGGDVKRKRCESVWGGQDSTKILLNDLLQRRYKPRKDGKAILNYSIFSGFPKYFDMIAPFFFLSKNQIYAMNYMYCRVKIIKLYNMIVSDEDDWSC